MKEYHKIQSIFKRDFETHRFIEDKYSLPEFEYLKDNIWVFTEKVDGTNIRINWDLDKIKIGGRTNNAQIPAFLYDKLNEIFTVDKFKALYPETTMCLYGEGYGAKIQKCGGNYNPIGVDFVLFDIKIDDLWLERKNIEDIAQKLKIDIVPIIGEGTIQDAINLIKKSIKSKWGDFQAEGLVLKPKIELQTHNGNRIITKIKHRDF